MYPYSGYPPPPTYGYGYPQPPPPPPPPPPPYGHQPTVHLLPPVKPKSSARVALFVLVTVAVLVVLGVGGYLVWHYAISPSSSSTPSSPSSVPHSSTSSSSTASHRSLSSSSSSSPPSSPQPLPAFDHSVLFYLSASSLPLGTSLSVWHDLSPAHNDFVQSNAPAQPQVRPVNQYTAVYFTLGSSTMQATLNTFPVNNDYSILLVGLATPVCSGVTSCYMVGSASNGHAFVVQPAGSSYASLNGLQGGDILTTFPTVQINYNTYCLMELIYTSSSMSGELYIHSVGSEQFTAQQPVTDSSIVLGGYNGIAQFDGYLFEVMLFNSTLNSTYRAYLLNYFEAIYPGI